MPDYPSNSTTNYTDPKKSKTKKVEEEPKPKLEKAISGSATKRKTPLGTKLRETFTGDDAQSVGNYVLFDVILPATKAMVSDAVSQGVERMLFGEVRRTQRRSPQGGSSHIAYNRVGNAFSGQRTPDRVFGSEGQQSMSRRGRSSHDFGEIILESRSEAELIIERMGDVLDAYDVVTVSDLYDLVGISGSFTDNKWGWFDLRSAGFTRAREGYILSLPRPQPID